MQIAWQVEGPVAVNGLYEAVRLRLCRRQQKTGRERARKTGKGVCGVQGTSLLLLGFSWSKASKANNDAKNACAHTGSIPRKREKNKIKKVKGETLQLQKMNFSPVRLRKRVNVLSKLALKGKMINQRAYDLRYASFPAPKLSDLIPVETCQLEAFPTYSLIRRQQLDVVDNR